MELTLNTPALLFPAITLLMLAYTNRFLAIASLIRSLHSKFDKKIHNPILIGQIRNLRLRLNLIRYMQGLGVLSFFLCVASMYALFRVYEFAAKTLFAASLLCLLLSLFISLIEIIKSTRALELELSDMEGLIDPSFFKDLLSRGEEKND